MDGGGGGELSTRGAMTERALEAGGALESNWAAQLLARGLISFWAFALFSRLGLGVGGGGGREWREGGHLFGRRQPACVESGEVQSGRGVQDVTWWWSLGDEIDGCPRTSWSGRAELCFWQAQSPLHSPY